MDLSDVSSITDILAIVAFCVAVVAPFFIAYAFVKIMEKREGRKQPVPEHHPQNIQGAVPAYRPNSSGFVSFAHQPTHYYVPAHLAPAKPDSTFRRVWRAAYPILMYFAIQFLVSLIAVLIAVMNMVWVSAVSPTSMADAVWEFLLALAIAEIISIPLLILFRRMDIKRLKKRGTYRRYERITVGKCAVAAAIGIACSCFAIGMFTLAGDPLSESDNSVFGLQPIMAVLLIGVLTPVAEELLFRVLLYGRLREWLSPMSAALICSLVFALAHGNATQGVTAFCYGLIMCLLYERWKSFWAPFLVHAGINTTTVVISIVPGALSAFALGPALVVIIVVAAVVLVGGILFGFKSPAAQERPEQETASYGGIAQHPASTSAQLPLPQPGIAAAPDILR